MKVKIKMDGVGFGYPEQAPILSAIDLEIESGERVLILGPNGSGKSTQALLIAGLLAPTSGTISRQHKHGIGIVFQDSHHQMVGSTVSEDLAFGLSVRNVPSSEIEEKVELFLNKFHLSSKRDYNINQLSGGEMRCLALASVLITEPDILILDEPLTMLDLKSQRLFLNCLTESIRPETAIIWFDHEVKNIRYNERYFVLSKQRGFRKASLSDLNTKEYLSENGLTPAPLQFLEWRYPGRISGAIFGPERIRID